jgi:hypothetical protein
MTVQGFLFAEDMALREKLQGMVVHDQKADGSATAARPVGVFFGQPDQELRTQNYPYITIDMVDVQRDTQREMRGITDAAYLQPVSTIAGVTEFNMDLPIPVNIDYQITTWSRHPRHDREILAQLLTSRLQRFGYLEVLEKEVTSGNTETISSTFRRLDLINVAKRDSTEQAKRLFVNALSVRVSSEILQSAYRAMYQVLEVHVDMPTGGRQTSFEGIGAFVTP